MQEFDLNIGKILENWDIYHAIREIIANALDEQLLTNTPEMEIRKEENAWCIRDFGRGLSYHHLMQNENPEKTENDKVIGRFGVGLKDALATLYRYNIRIEIQSKHGVITLKESPKNSFDDIITLHAQIEPPNDEKMSGTAFYIYGCPDSEMDKAKNMFLCFTNEEILDSTSCGQIIKSKEIANIYINGIKVAEEPNFAFSYNITALSKQIKKALNRERINVGRTAYADRIKCILLESTDEEIINVLSRNLEAMSDGTQCDEIKWVDVASHVVQVLNDSDDTVFVTPDEITNNSGNTNEILENSGKRIVFVPENVKKKAEQESDGKISTIESVIKQYNESFSYVFIDVQQLTETEKDNWNKIPLLLEKLNLSGWFEKCLISEQLKEDPDNTVGVWDQELQKIVILRTQLKNETDLFGTVLHEIIHAKTGATDVSRFFECELTDMIGKLSTMNISNTNNDANIDENQFNIKSWLDGNVVDDYDEYEYNIDTRRVALLSFSGDVHWCGDCFGILSLFTKHLQYCKKHCIEEYNQKCAIYEENGTLYWLVYNYSKQSEKDFLYVTTVDNMLDLDKNQGVTVYDEASIYLLRDYMKNAALGFSKEYGLSKLSTYDSYLSIIRQFLIIAGNRSRKDLLSVAEHLREGSKNSDKDIEKFIDAHICPVCGCYFTSKESECVKCGFDGINTEAMKDLNYINQWKIKPYECRLSSNKCKEGLKIVGTKVEGFDKRYKTDMLVIPYGITEICAYAFKDVAHIKKIYLPNSLEIIGERAFEYCEDLSDIAIPDSVTNIEECAFSCCSYLAHINVDVNNEIYTSIDGNLYSKDKMTLIQYAIGKSDIEFTIPKEVRTISTYAFECSFLKKITIHDNVELIQHAAFMYSRYLREIIIGKDVKEIKSFAFAGCESLENIVVPPKVSYIGEETFYRCKNLRNIILDCKVESIEGWLFQECENLFSITLTPTIKEIKHLVFCGCKNLKYIIFLGTKKEWKSIKKAENWDDETGNYIVSCSDGTISK